MTEPSDEGKPETSADTGASQRLTEGLSTHAIFTLDTEGSITTWPPPAQTLYGYDESEALGRQLTMLFAEETEPEPSPIDLLGNALEGSYETTVQHRRADGSEFWAIIALVPLEDGTLDGYAVVSYDTTAQRQERERVKKQNDRLKQFTDILAHDLRNPLRLIEGRLELYREPGKQSPLDTVDDTTRRMRALVGDLLEVATHGSAVTNPDYITIAELIEMAWNGTGGQAPEATLRVESVGTVSGDADKMLRLFENLFWNAIEHGGPTVSVCVGPLETGFYLADDGPGIPEGIREEVFDHGVSTASSGTGYCRSFDRLRTPMDGT